MGEVNTGREIIAYDQENGHSDDTLADLIDAALRRAKAEGVLEWTSDKPKVPGWYWYRENQGAPKFMTMVTEVFMTTRGLRVSRGGPKETLESMAGEWAGPIAAPIDARAAQIEEGLDDYPDGVYPVPPNTGIDWTRADMGPGWKAQIEEGE